jgi:hypothetical protein
MFATEIEVGKGHKYIFSYEARSKLNGKIGMVGLVLMMGLSRWGNRFEF